jgi:Fic family protein
VQLSQNQFERLTKTRNEASWKVFFRLLFLDWRYPGNIIRLGNIALNGLGVSRNAKRRALDELEELGFIKVKSRNQRASPEVVVLR